MIYLGYIIIYFAGLRLLVSFFNCITCVSLPKSAARGATALVSILIPARNEEDNIGTILADIIRLSYHNYEVLVYDDCSTDRTAEIVEEYRLKDSRIKLVKGKALEAGWLGKNNGCYQLSLIARGQYYLFLDADVRVSGDLIERSLRYTQKHNLGLLSIFPRQKMESVAERVSVPIMNRILLSLLPLILVRVSRWTSFSGANGQFMLFDADIYQKTQPHVQCRSAKAEDIAICRYYKKRRIKVSTLLGDCDIECRMYKSIGEAVNGFSKNVFAFFGNSISATLLYAFYTSFAPLALLCIFGGWVFWTYLATIALMQVFISAASRQNILANLILLPAQQCVFLWIVFSAISKSATKSLEWKGRNITVL